jgi:hypothetical protein
MAAQQLVKNEVEAFVPILVAAFPDASVDS